MRCYSWHSGSSTRYLWLWWSEVSKLLEAEVGGKRGCLFRKVLSRGLTIWPSRRQACEPFHCKCLEVLLLLLCAARALG
jgi:hypothetical protein